MLPHLIATVVAGVVLLGAVAGISPPHLIGCVGLALLSYAVYGSTMMIFPEKMRILGANFRAFVGIFPALGAAGQRKS
jgi:hypothetical protein